MDLEKLIGYDEWANREVYDAFQKLDKGGLRDKIQEYFSHILTSQKVWVSRATGDECEVEIWPELTENEVKSFMESNPEQIKRLIPIKDEFFSYQNSKGETFTNRIEDILLHLTIHGQHHRAQIAKLLRKADITPPPIDFIFFLRQK